jgi:hypothetical protein
MKISFSRLSLAGTLALAAGLSSLCLAQTSPSRSRVTITHIKPDMVNEWMDLQKSEVVPALKKGGVKTRTVYSAGIFGNGGEYLTTQPFDNTAEFDGQSPLVKALDAPGAARLNGKLAKCLVSTNSYMSTRLDDISNVMDTPPTVIVAVRYRIAQGKMQEFRDLFKSELLPVYKKAKVSVTVNQRGPGGNPADVNVVTGYAKYAEMNAGPFLVQQLGQVGADRVNAKFAAIRTTVEVVVRRRVPELSF